FFFQAEDGIRDRNVTGVQTCTLPIYERGARRVPLTRIASCDAIRPLPARGGEAEFAAPSRTRQKPSLWWRILKSRSVSRERCSRSEERRVGKEGRSMWVGGGEERDEM